MQNTAGFYTVVLHLVAAGEAVAETVAVGQHGAGVERR
jgi:hypothetical protein